MAIVICYGNYNPVVASRRKHAKHAVINPFDWDGLVDTG